jgi:hypothetical protein
MTGNTMTEKEPLFERVAIMEAGINASPKNLAF